MFKEIIDISVFQSTIRMSTPILLAAMGALITSAAGIINIGLEGMMLSGAFFAIVASYYFSSIWAGVLAALLSGVLTALLFAIFALRFKGHLILLGTALNYLATALTVFLLRTLFGVAGAFADPRIVGFKAVHIPIIQDIPFLGKLISGHVPVVYVTWLLVVGLHIFLYKTPLGIHLRAVGENPDAAAVVGIKVKTIQYFSIICSGVFSALAGAYLSLGQLTMFTENMSANRGFMGLSANIFGMGTPVGAMLASFLFGFGDALAMRLQGFGVIKSQIVLMLPPLLTITMLYSASVRKKAKLKKTRTENVKEALAQPRS